MEIGLGGVDRGGGGGIDPLVQYRLRAVRIGVQTTFMALAILAVFPLLPRHGDIRLVPYAAIMAGATLGAIAISLLPWGKLVERRLDLWAFYVWSALDIALITVAVGVTGGEHSVAFVLYVLTTLFFAAVYPLRSQIALLAFTLACYLGALAVTGWDISPAVLWMRLTILVMTAVMASFLSRELADRVEELRDSAEKRQLLLQHLISAQEAERKRIAGDIHDDSVQVMAGVGLQLDSLKRRIEDPEDLEILAELQDAVRGATGRLRTLLFELVPPEVEQHGLAAAFGALLSRLAETANIEVRLEDRLPHEPPAGTRIVAYRIAQEALANVRKHARAGRVEVRLEHRAGGLLVELTDDGVGFVREGSGNGHMGLASMRERAELAGGWCHLASTPGAGTSVQFWLPLPLLTGIAKISA